MRSRSGDLRRAVAIAGVGLGSALLAAPAIAQAPRPTLSFDRSCYGEQELMSFSGEQYTPGGEVALLFATAGRIGTFSLSADAAGAIGGTIDSPDMDHFLADDEARGSMAVTANDQTRLEDGTADTDPEATFGLAEFTITRTWAAIAPRAPRPGRRLTVRVFGWAEAAGTPLYLHYVQRSKVREVTRLGVPKGDCGDLRRRIPRAFPFKARAGRYTLYVSTARRDATSGSYFRFRARVGPKHATASARTPVILDGRQRVRAARG